MTMQDLMGRCPPGGFPGAGYPMMPAQWQIRGNPAMAAQMGYGQPYGYMGAENGNGNGANMDVSVYNGNGNGNGYDMNGNGACPIPYGSPGFIPGGCSPYGYGCELLPTQPLLVQQVEPQPRLRPQCFTTDYVELLGFPPTCIRPCETVVIQTQSPILFQVQEIHIPEHIAHCLLFHSIAMGKFELIANKQPVPGTCFSSHGGSHIKLKPQTLNVGVPFTVVVENICNADVKFTGCAIGIAFEAC